MPTTPISVSASFTSSSLKGLMMASIFFMSSLPEYDGGSDRFQAGGGGDRHARVRCWLPRAGARWEVSLIDTSRGGLTTVSEQLSTRRRQRALKDDPSRSHA